MAKYTGYMGERPQVFERYKALSPQTLDAAIRREEGKVDKARTSLSAIEELQNINALEEVTGVKDGKLGKIEVKDAEQLRKEVQPVLEKKRDLERKFQKGEIGVPELKSGLIDLKEGYYDIMGPEGTGRRVQQRYKRYNENIKELAKKEGLSPEQLISYYERIGKSVDDPSSNIPGLSVEDKVDISKEAQKSLEYALKSTKEFSDKKGEFNRRKGVRENRVIGGVSRPRVMKNVISTLGANEAVQKQMLRNYKYLKYTGQPIPTIKKNDDGTPVTKENGDFVVTYGKDPKDVEFNDYKRAAIFRQANRAMAKRTVDQSYQESNYYNWAMRRKKKKEEFIQGKRTINLGSADTDTEKPESKVTNPTNFFSNFMHYPMISSKYREKLKEGKRKSDKTMLGILNNLDEDYKKNMTLELSKNEELRGKLINEGLIEDKEEYNNFVKEMVNSTKFKNLFKLDDKIMDWADSKGMQSEGFTDKNKALGQIRLAAQETVRDINDRYEDLLDNRYKGIVEGLRKQEDTDKTNVRGTTATSQEDNKKIGEGITGEVVQVSEISGKKYKLKGNAIGGDQVVNVVKDGKKLKSGITIKEAIDKGIISGVDQLNGLSKSETLISNLEFKMNASLGSPTELMDPGSQVLRYENDQGETYYLSTYLNEELRENGTRFVDEGIGFNIMEGSLLKTDKLNEAAKKNGKDKNNPDQITLFADAGSVNANTTLNLLNATLKGTPEQRRDRINNLKESEGYVLSSIGSTPFDVYQEKETGNIVFVDKTMPSNEYNEKVKTIEKQNGQKIGSINRYYVPNTTESKEDLPFDDISLKDKRDRTYNYHNGVYQVSPREYSKIESISNTIEANLDSGESGLELLFDGFYNQKDIDVNLQTEDQESDNGVF